ncbi:MAG: methyltransferase domain-containing protein [Planctomycetia bacterium]|nr:methyltransferase domain-containing protein [Planctomycetia bacterium]
MFSLPDFSQRQVQPEVMDQPGLDADRHRRALAGLRRINSISASARIIWPAILKLARANSDSLRVLDVASGGGDVPIALCQLAHQQRVRLTMVGCDLSPVAVEYAARAAQHAGCAIEFRVGDVLQEPLPTGFDVITSSLFLHHLSHSDAVQLLRRMGEVAGQMVLINDLRRSLAGYALAQAACRLLTTSAVVRTDGPRSVANAFTIPEMNALCAEAGLEGAVVHKRWPCRMLVVWKRPA